MSDLSEYQEKMLQIERQKNKIEVAKVLALPATLLITALGAWWEITAANERSALESTDQYEMSLIETVDRAQDRCLLKDMMVALYGHHVQERPSDPRHQWYRNVKSLLEKRCQAEVDSDRA